MIRRNGWLASASVTALLVGCGGEGSRTPAPSAQEIQRRSEDMKSKMMEGGMMKGMDQMPGMTPEMAEKNKKTMGGAVPGQAGPMQGGPGGPGGAPGGTPAQKP